MVAVLLQLQVQITCPRLSLQVQHTESPSYHIGKFTTDGNWLVSCKLRGCSCAKQHTQSCCGLSAASICSSLEG